MRTHASADDQYAHPLVILSKLNHVSSVTLLCMRLKACFVSAIAKWLVRRTAQLRGQSPWVLGRCVQIFCCILMLCS